MAIRVGVVGLGMMGTTHFRGYQEIDAAQVAAVCDVSGKKLSGDWAEAAGNIDTGAAAAQDLSALKTYGDYAEFLADGDIDLVDLCVPTFQHADMTIQALEAGKHVFCEKPMARTSAMARQMVETAETCDRLLAVGHVLRFWPEYLILKEMIDDRRYGAVRSAVLTRLSPRPQWSWDNWILDEGRSGGAPLDLHIHDADTVQWFFGRPATVTASGTFEGNAISHIVARYAWGDDSPLVVAEGGWDYPQPFPFRMAASLVFEKAAVEFSTLNSPTLAVYEEGDPEPVHPDVPAHDGYTEELRYFVECVASGTKPERIDPAAAVRAIAIVEAEMESARTGKPVDVQA
jgi:predicted dehydrogenase